MEQNVPVTAKRVWSIVKAVLFMMKRGIVSKSKLMVDLNTMLKRGKTAGAKAIGNLMSHHHHNNNNNDRQVVTFSTAEAAAAASANEYEFSCSNTPNYIFPFNLASKKKNYYHSLFACTNTPRTLDDDNMATAVNFALEMLNNNNNNNVVGASPMLPGFGQTPLARQLRITDSPFPLKDVDGDNDYVNKAAEDFINRFYKDLKQQNTKMADS